MFAFMPVTYCFGYYDFISFEARKCDAPTFVVLLQGCFGYLECFMVPYEFQNFFSISVNIVFKILMWIVLNLWVTLHSMDILTNFKSLAYCDTNLYSFHSANFGFYSLF